MPTLKVCGVRLVASSDDMSALGISGFVYRGIWTVVAATFTYMLWDDIVFCLGTGEVLESRVPNYNGSLIFMLCYYGAIACLSLVQLLLFIWMTRISLRGTILQYRRRSFMQYVIILMGIVEVLHIVLTAFGVYVLAKFLTTEAAPEQDDNVDLQYCPQAANVSFGQTDETLVDEYDRRESLLMVYIIVALVFSVVNHIGFVLLLKFGRLRRHHKHDLGLDQAQRDARKWERRCRSFCCFAQIISCNLFGGIDGFEADEGFTAVAEVFSKWFKGTKLSNSDFVAALLLIRAEQRELERTAVVKGNVLTSQLDNVEEDSPQINLDSPQFGKSSASSSPSANLKRTRSRLMSSPRLTSTPKFQRIGGVDAGGKGIVPLTPGGSFKLDGDLEAGIPHHNHRIEFVKLLETAQHYAPYMLGIYGWRLFLYMNRYKPFTGIRKLVLPKRTTGGAEGDTCCNFGEKTILNQVGGQRQTEIVYASFSNYANQKVPIAISVDRQNQEVVLMVRGTMSLADAMTDAVIHPTELSLLGSLWGFDGKGHYAHDGMLKVAMYLREELDRLQILERLFRGDGVSSSGHLTKGRKAASRKKSRRRFEPLVQIDDEEDLPNCEGFKLMLVGHSLGGGIVSLLSVLLRPAFPELKCMVYSAPGTIMSYELAEESKQWIDNVWVGKDFVVMASWHALIKLRKRMLDVIVRSKANKSKIFRTMLQDIPVEELLYTDEEFVDSPETREFMHLTAAARNADEKDLGDVSLYPPGNLLHMMKVESIHTQSCCSPRCCNVKERSWEPVWVEDRRLIGDFQISSRMLFDHFPDYVSRVIDQVADEYCYYSPSTESLALKTLVNPRFNEE